MNRFDGLDAIRGAAVLLVVGCHAGVPGLSVGGGTAGVTVFFVLSGFLITRILLRREPMVSFYVRRAARLLPALALMLVVVGAFYTGARLETRSFMTGAVLSLSYVANWFPLTELGPLLHTWSLSVEEQFYLAWPFALLVIPRRHLWAAFLAVIVISLVIRGLVSHPHAIRGTDTNAYALVAGAMLAQARLPRAPRATIGIGAILIAVAAAGPRDFGSGFLWGVDFRWSPPVAAAGAVLLVWAAISHEVSVPRWLVHISAVSYGWYLWHLPLMLAFDLGLRGRLFAAVVALLCAEASYRWVERPVQEWARGRVQDRPPAASLAT